MFLSCSLIRKYSYSSRNICLPVPKYALKRINSLSANKIRCIRQSVVVVCLLLYFVVCCFFLVFLGFFFFFFFFIKICVLTIHVNRLLGMICQDLFSMKHQNRIK